MKSMRWSMGYFAVSLFLMITYPLYEKYLPETAKNVIFTLLVVNIMISFFALMFFNPRRGAKPYFVCGKCNNVFPYPENRLGGTRSIVLREFCPRCKKERLCYIKYYRNIDGE